MSDTVFVNGSELLRRLKRIARERGLELRLVERHGKGSHATVFFGSHRTTMKDRKKEIGPGLLAAMLQDLGLSKRDIE